MNRLGLILFGSAIALAGCKGGDTTEATAAGTEIGIDLAGMDKSVKPGDDFNAFVSGGWEKATEIPADRTNLGSFTTVAIEVEKRNKALLQGLFDSNPAAGTNERRIVDYHNAFTNLPAIEQRGLQPLAPHYAEIDGVRDVGGLSRAIGKSVRADVDPLNATNLQTENLMGVFVAQALQDPNRNVAYLLQGGIGLPDREYYLSTAAPMVKTRDGYRKYLADLGAALGWPDAKARADRVFALETKIAQVHVGAVEAQDAKAPKEWTVADYQSNAPGMDWRAFLDGAQLGGQQTIIAWHPKPINGLSALVASQPKFASTFQNVPSCRYDGPELLQASVTRTGQ